MHVGDALGLHSVVGTQRTLHRVEPPVVLDRAGCLRHRDGREELVPAGAMLEPTFQSAAQAGSVIGHGARELVVAASHGIEHVRAKRLRVRLSSDVRRRCSTTSDRPKPVQALVAPWFFTGSAFGGIQRSPSASPRHWDGTGDLESRLHPASPPAETADGPPVFTSLFAIASAFPAASARNAARFGARFTLVFRTSLRPAAALEPFEAFLLGMTFLHGTKTANRFGSGRQRFGTDARNSASCAL